MGWLENLRGQVQRAVTQGPSAVKRFAGQALGLLDRPFTRPTIGLKPEIRGAVVSALLPEDSPVKALVDAGLYLGSGPMMMSLGLAGSTPQSDEPYGSWQRLGYKSREDMVQRIEQQKHRDRALAAKAPGTYTAEDYGPARPIRLDDGSISLGDYRIERFTPVAAEVGSTQPRRGGTIPPAASRPIEEQHTPVSREIPASPLPAPRRTENELSRMYAEQYKLGRAMEQGGELQRRLREGGAVQGMSDEALMTWVEAHPDLAYRLAMKRGLLPENNLNQG